MKILLKGSANAVQIDDTRSVLSTSYLKVTMCEYMKREEELNKPAVLSESETAKFNAIEWDLSKITQQTNELLRDCSFSAYYVTNFEAKITENSTKLAFSLKKHDKRCNMEVRYCTNVVSVDSNVLSKIAMNVLKSAKTHSKSERLGNYYTIIK